MKSKKINSLYIHIPFCKHICRYCDFTKLLYNDNFSNLYIRQLFKELNSYKIGKVSTIYIGGGTPTSLNDNQFEELLKKVSPHLRKNGEFSIEANVENLTLKKLLLMRQYNVNRLSIGVESTDDKMLELIGRKHTFNDAKNAIKSAKEVGFDNINIDLIYGFPNQTIEQLQKDLENFINLNVDHVSIYSLIVEKGTMFYNDNIVEQNQDDSRQYYDEILSFLRKNGYKRYEISNFARNKKYSKHNLTYWKDKQYYGIGLGASGYINNIRYTNTKSLSKYLNGEYIDFKEKIDKKLEIEDYLLTNFRLEDGFKDKDFFERFGVSFSEMFKSMIKSLEKDNYLIIKNGKIRFSDDGLMIMDHLLNKIL